MAMICSITVILMFFNTNHMIHSTKVMELGAGTQETYLLVA